MSIVVAIGVLTVIVPSRPILCSSGSLQATATLRLRISILHKHCAPEVHGSVGHVAGSLARVNVVNNKLPFSRTQYTASDWRTNSACSSFADV